jgi:glycosyltransferase involved in cell wall biosynthesis
MHILIFSHLVPFPLDEGGKVAQYVILKELLKHATVTFVAWGQPLQKEQLIQLKLQLPSLNTRWISVNTTEIKKPFWYKYASIIHWELTKKLRKYELQDAVIQNPFFVQPIQLFGENFAKQFNQILEETKPDCVQVEFIDNASIALLIPQAMPSVMVMHDLRFSTVMQALRLDSKYSDHYSKYLKKFVRTAELAYICRFSNIITFSKEDEMLLSEHLAPEIVRTIPFAIGSEQFIPIHPLEPSEAVSHIIFIGPDHHQPNLDAMEWYIHHIHPPLYAKTCLPLKIAGKWQSKNVGRFSNISGIEFLGFVEDLSTVTKQAIMVVPLRLGSGIRTKILEAFASGIPVVSTTIGCEGIPAIDGKHVLIADTVEEFIAAVHKLQKIAVHNTLVANARLLAEEMFSPDAVVQQRLVLYKKLLLKKLF